MKRVTATITLAVLILASTAVAGERPKTITAFFEPDGGTRVIAHRGFSGRAPENTMAAIRGAIVVGADMVEIDVTLSSDGKIVVIHDETLDRTTDGTGLVADQALADLQELDAGSWFDPRFAGERIPTLERVLAEVDGKILLNIEIKSEAVDRGLAAEVVEAVRRSRMQDQTVISSFSPSALDQVHRMAPGLVTAVLFNADVHRGLDAVDIVEKLGASAFNIKRQRLTSAMLRRCNEHGIPIGIYTVNKKRHMRRMVKKGVAAIFTDHPDRLIELLRKQSPPGPNVVPSAAGP